MGRDADRCMSSSKAAPLCQPDPATRRTAELEAAKARLEAELATARSVIRIQGELSALLAKLSPSSVVPPESEHQQ